MRSDDITRDGLGHLYDGATFDYDPTPVTDPFAEQSCGSDCTGWCDGRLSCQQVLALRASR